MAQKLVIVESPTKSRAIEQYLGSDYKVIASKGHIRDLAISGPGGLGIDINNNFRPEYKILPEKQETVKQLNTAVKKASEIILATDPDREGEAISWHLKETLAIGDKPISRVAFNEITKPAILAAFQVPRAIDMDLVSSQETRRIIDRIIGFKLSKLMQSKIRSKSAGRVQSAALKLIVDKEKEVEKFVITEYYEIHAQFADFSAKLNKWHQKPAKIGTALKADEILDSLGQEFQVTSVDTTRKPIASKPPFITSTLQQEASNRLNMTSQKTMQIAQKLYEGVLVRNQIIGLITYMRTDSIRLSPGFVHEAENHIEKTYGSQYLGHPKKAIVKNKIQGAHEAIRPTDVTLIPDMVRQALSREEFLLYQMIYFRTVASMMKPALVDQTIVELKNGEALFRAIGTKPVFDGYRKAYGKYDVDDEATTSLPSLETGMHLKASEVVKKQLFTIPPARYSEAKLIKEMEELGIGRPSTYAQTIQTIKSRRYVTIKDKKFVPTEQGTITIEKLDEYFAEFVSANYSRQMEDTLDEIEKGAAKQLEVIRDFYVYFEPLVANASKLMQKEKPKETGELCPVCGSPMVHRHGKFGDFEACGNYPS
jgi:DNA topoisomerase-1